MAIWKTSTTSCTNHEEFLIMKCSNFYESNGAWRYVHCRGDIVNERNVFWERFSNLPPEILSVRFGSIFPGSVGLPTPHLYSSSIPLHFNNYQNCCYCSSNSHIPSLFLFQQLQQAKVVTWSISPCWKVKNLQHKFSDWKWPPPPWNFSEKSSVLVSSPVLYQESYLNIWQTDRDSVPFLMKTQLACLGIFAFGKSRFVRRWTLL